MIKKYRDYIILLIVFLLVIFSANINSFLLALNNDLDVENINNNYCTSLEKEYNELLKINEFAISSELELIVSKVYLRNIYEFTDKISIYKGSNDNITEGMAVINDKGLIGVVDKVTSDSSDVLLITNKNSNISVKIGSSYGILKNKGDELIVSDLQVYDEVNVGDEIYTSGIGNLPGDLYIGKVKEVLINDTGIEKSVVVEKAIDMANINYLLVVG